MSAKANELQPGTVLRHKDGTRVVLDRRKDPGAHRRPTEQFWPGWWVVDGGGLADFVIDAKDSQWTVL